MALILRRGTSGKEILLRRSAHREWSAVSLGAYDFRLFDAIATVLKTDGLQAKKHAMDEEGETYAFVFSYHTPVGPTPVYTKINLIPGGKIIIIYSAHRPEKQDELTS